MIAIFYTVVLSVIQGVALNTRVLPFSKGRALHIEVINNNITGELMNGTFEH
jgi:hypothetical protein